MTKIRSYYEIEDGLLKGTILEPIMAFIAVKYPHRKTKDLYIPPIEDDNKKVTHSWHCCQDNCEEPNFYGGLDALLKHIELHAGRLIKRARIEAH